MWTIVETGDGTNTLYNSDLNESYHSRFGAVQESQHVFIRNGLLASHAGSSIHVFEIGLGTGLNALLSAAVANDARQIHYTAIEAHPLEEDIIAQLNYASADGLFADIHQAPWGESVEITPYFTLNKIKADFCAYAPQQTYDVLYYDAFAPDVQPELWTAAVWTKLAAMTRKDGVLVTYCAKGVVRRGLEAAGFAMERLPGPPGKREMLRGIKLH